MIEKYYYLRKATESGEHRCGIAYVVMDKDAHARGVSLCNESEDPFLRDEGFILDRKKKAYYYFEGGLEKARKRAIKALRSRKSSEPVRIDKAKEKIGGLNIEFKSEYAPLLNDLEIKIINASVAR